jgi:hypothetical protein
MRRSTEHDSASRRESLYRDALRFALLDRKVTREEELHLFRLAEELGIGAGRAMELRLEVEAGQRRGPKVVR